MFKKKKQNDVSVDNSNKKLVPRVVCKVLNNCRPVPVAPEADEIQLGPVNLPIVIHPYASHLEQDAPMDEYED